MFNFQPFNLAGRLSSEKNAKLVLNFYKQTQV
ncbi:hypothetical protein PARA125_000229 [Parachlamydia sp. AcF125]|nr:hypothetical protein [Parachlamydia sp. AcF125]